MAHPRQFTNIVEQEVPVVAKIPGVLHSEQYVIF